MSRRSPPTCCQLRSSPSRRSPTCSTVRTEAVFHGSPPTVPAGNPQLTQGQADDGTDHPSHKEQGSMIRRYIIWRNKHARDERLREVVNRANVA